MSRFFAITGAVIDRIKVNTAQRVVREERAYWIKKRRPPADPLLRVANVFFRMAGAPMRTIPNLHAWQQWEVDSFHGLHGADGFRAFAEGRRGVGIEEMPGINLTVPLDDGTITPAMTTAAGKELRRAHAWHCEQIRSLWSHGDPHAGNFLYDAAAGRARIIDFEVMHDPSLPAEIRHADDVLVFLQDIAGRIPADRWLPCAVAFLAGYGEPAIVARVVPQLRLPAFGLSWLWWMVRATFLPPGELTRRLGALHGALYSSQLLGPSALPLLAGEA